MRRYRRRIHVYIQLKHSFCFHCRPERTTYYGHLLSARVVVHHDLLDLEDGVLLRRAGSPALVAVPINIVSMAGFILKSSFLREDLRPVVPHPVSILGSRHVRLELVLELVVQVESAGLAVPVDTVVVYSRESIRRLFAGRRRGASARCNSLIGVEQSATAAGVDV